MPFPSAVRAVAFHAGTAYLGHDDGWLEIWNTASSELVTRWRASDRPIQSLVVLSDGTLLSSSGETVARLWNVSERTLAARFDLDGARVTEVAASEDPTFALAGDDGAVGVWRDGARTATHHVPGAVTALAVSDDGRWIAAGNSDGDVSLFGGSARRSFRVADAQVSTLAFARHSSRLFAATRDGTVVYYDAPTARRGLRVAGCAWETTSSSFDGKEFRVVPCDRSPDVHPVGDSLLTAIDENLVLRATAQSISIRDATAPFHGGFFGRSWAGAGTYTCATIDPDRREALLCRSLGSCEILDLTTQKFGSIVGRLHRPVMDFAFDPDARRLVVLTGANTTVWTIPCRGAPRAVDLGFRSVAAAFSDGRLVASAYGGSALDYEFSAAVRIVDPAGRSRTLPGTEWPGPLTAIPNSPLFLFGSGGQRIAIGDSRSGTAADVIAPWCRGLAPCQESPGAPRDLAVSSDGRVVAAAAGAGSASMHCMPGPECGERGYTFAVWSRSATSGARFPSERWQLLWSRYGYAESAVALTPDGQSVAVGGPDGLVQIRDVTSARLHVTLPHQTPVRALAFTPDGSHLLTGDDTGVVRIWNLRALPEMHVIVAHAGPVTRIRALSARLAISSSDDGTLAVLNVGDARRVARFMPMAHGQWIVRTSDGRVEASDAARQSLEFRPMGFEGPHLPGAAHYREFAVEGLFSRALDGL